jgi:hypothetical protein
VEEHSRIAGRHFLTAELIVVLKGRAFSRARRREEIIAALAAVVSKRSTLMELVDRYLQAVKFWLPRKQKDDIIAELSEDLRSQIEDKHSELGHPLTDADVEAILKRCGAPMAVAGRYLPQRSLIGPTLFPIYNVVIRSLILYFLLPWLLLWLGIAIFSPDFRADHPGAALFLSLDPWWLACTYSLFFCTLAFALLDRSQMRSQLVKEWNPRSLPVVRDPNQIPRGATLSEITFSVATLAIWVQFGAFQNVFHFFGVTATVSPRWQYLFWALTVFSLAAIGLACLNLVNPRWTRLSASLRLGIDFYSCAVIYWICKANLVQSLTSNDLSPADAVKLVNTINFWVANSAMWVIVIAAALVFFDVRRLLRVGPAE